MSVESKTFAPEEEAGVSQASDAFVKLLEMGSPGVARNWAENITRFSEKPIGVELTDSESGGKEAKLSLVACERDLSLRFLQSGKLEICYGDENMRQTTEIGDAHWQSILFLESLPALLIRLENGGSVRILKEWGTVVTQSFSKQE